MRTSRKWSFIVASLVFAAGAGFAASAILADAKAKSEQEKFSEYNCRKLRALMNSFAARGSEKYKEVEQKYGDHARPDGAGHKLLQKMVGTWNTQAKIYDISGKYKEAVAVATFKPILDGRFITEDVVEKNSEFRGTGIYGYDTAKKEFFLLWVDNMSTGQQSSFGKGGDDGNSFTLKSETTELCEGGKVSFTETYKLEGTNEILYELYVKPDGKNEYKGMEIVYTRAE